MGYLIDILLVLSAAAITAALYFLYYQVFVKGYVKKIKRAYENGELDRVVRMKQYAMIKQPKRMAKLLADIQLNEFDSIKSMFQD